MTTHHPRGRDGAAVQIICGSALDVLRTLPSESVQLVVTSPPYFQLRDYGVDGQIGLEPTPALFIEHLVSIFDEVKRVLRPDGLCFVNLGSSYAGSGKGPTGHNGIGNQAKRQGFVGAGGSDPSQSLSLGHVPACDSDGRARSDSLETGSSYSGLCDECLADFLSHRARSLDTLARPSRAPLASKTDRDSERQAFGLAPADGAPLAVQESTTLESWRQLRGACSRCASRAASFARLGLPISEPVAQGSAHTMDDPFAPRSSADAIQDQLSSTAYKGETDDASVDRIVGTDVGSSSYQYFSRLDRQRRAKSLIMIPAMFALAMEERGWIVRQEIVWAKTSAMPESVRDRMTSAWEPIWMFAKSQRYYWDQEAVRQPDAGYKSGNGFDGRMGGARDTAVSGGNGTAERFTPGAGANLRNVWLLGPSPFSDAHFATFPPEIPRRCILAGTSEKGACGNCGAPWVRLVERVLAESGRKPGASEYSRRDPRFARGGAFTGNSADTLGWQPSCSCKDAGPPVPCVVLDPFLGSGTTLLVASRLGRAGVGIELSPAYTEMARKRIAGDAPLLTADTVTVSAPEQLPLLDPAAAPVRREAV